MKPETWLSQNKSTFGSGSYEEKFVLNVLFKVEGLDFNAIRTQYRFVDSDGKTRYCNFVLQEGSSVKIAIEVDDYDKDGSGRGMSPPDFVDWQRRQAALVSQGWFVLRFANADVRDYPERCRQHIELLLRNERKKDDHQSRLEASIQELRGRLTQAARQSAGTAEIKELTEHIKVLQRQLEFARDTQPLAKDESEYLYQLSAAQEKIPVLQGKSSVTKTIVWAFTTLIIVLIVAFVYYLSVNGPPPSPTTTGMPISTLGTSCTNPVNWHQAHEFEGRHAGVEGIVTDLTYRQDINGKPTWISIGAKYPNKKRLELVIWEGNRSNFGVMLSDRLETRTVCVEGVVKQFRGIAQIELQQPQQLIFRD